MKQTLSLLKVLFKQSYRKGKGVERSKKGKVGIAILYAFTIIVLAPYLFVSLYTLAKFALSANAGREYISIVMFSIQGFALVFGTISLVNIMFLSKDNEIISSLPIPQRKVFTAKFLYVLLHELMLGVAIGFVGVGIYGVISSANVLFYILGVLAVVIAPILALAISSVLLLPIILICTKLRKTPIIAGLLSILLFGGGMYLYMNFIFGISSGMGEGSFDNIINTMFNVVASKLFFNMFVADVVFLVPNFAMSLLYAIIIYAGLFAIACILTSLVYKKASTLMTEKNSGSDIKSSNAKNSIMKALIIRDLKSIIRFPMLLVMCASQILFSPIMIFVMAKLYTADMIEMQIGMMFMMGTMFVCGINCFASGAFSRENDSINILKTIPVDVSTIVTSKLIIALIASIITDTLVAIAMLAVGVDTITTLLFFVYFAALSVGMMAWQIRGDLDKPKLGWTNVNEGLKNNKASILPMFTTMGIGILGMFALLFIGMIKPNIVMIILIILILISSIFSTLQLRSLYKNAEKLFAKIEY